jgi:tRNA nucleotidyltransferase (CCA-adding enzyme)
VDVRNSSIQITTAHLPSRVRELLDRAAKVGTELRQPVFAVGGFVRDLLLGRPNSDLDLVVEGEGMAFARRLAGELKADLQEVSRFGTAHLSLPDEPGGRIRIDVASARREVYKDPGALPVVTYAGIRADLRRRDFTINTLAFRLSAANHRQVIDLVGGCADLKNQLIRIMHKHSFSEDPTRIFRAARFSARYGFHLEAETATCLKSAVAERYLNRLSAHRIRTELLLLLDEPSAAAGFLHLQEWGVLEQLFPGLAIPPELPQFFDALQHTCERIPGLCTEEAVCLARLLLLLHRMPSDESARFVRSLGFEGRVEVGLIDALNAGRAVLARILHPNASPSSIWEALCEWTPPGLLLLATLGGMGQVERFWNEWRRSKLLISGTDLITAGIPAGPRIGAALCQVHREHLDGRAPDRETQLNLALGYARREE